MGIGPRSTTHRTTTGPRCLLHDVGLLLCSVQVIYSLLQNIDGIPDDLKKLYRTVWELSQKTVIKMAADRGAYIDQSQSLNIHIAEPNYGKLTSMHFYSWKMVHVH